MAISWLTRQASTSVQVAAVQAAADANVDASEGSITLAYVQAVNGVLLWLQGLVAQAIAIARLRTSFGTDADSFVGDFGMTRLAGVAGTTQETLARLTTGNAVSIPVGALISTGPGGVQFAVAVDSSNAAYNAETNAYTLASGVLSVSVPVQCTQVGVVGNVAAGAINSPVSPIIGIDTYTNPIAITNGLPAETDAALKARFKLFIASLASATEAAIKYAAVSVQQGVRIQIANNVPRAGFFTAYVDDGSGNPPDSFITAETTAIQAVAAEGVQPAVMRFAKLNVSINAILQVALETSRPATVANASAALAAYVAALPLSDTGMTLEYLKLPGVILGADSNITGIASGSLTLNGGVSDITAPIGQLIEAQTITVS